MPQVRRKASESTNLIDGMGILSIVAFIVEHGARLADKAVAVYIDNNCALSALVKGSAKSEVLANVVQIFWLYVQKFEIEIWLQRVPSTRNIADLPTRGRRIPFQAEEELRFSKLDQLFAELKNKMSRNQHERDLLLGPVSSSKLIRNMPRIPVRSSPYRRAEKWASAKNSPVPSTTPLVHGNHPPPSPA